MKGYPRLRRWLDGLFPGRPLRVLFIGNSLTYYQASTAGETLVLNDLPGLLVRMSQSRGERRILEADKITEDAASLGEHCISQLVEEALRPRAWDYVVLQENSERALSHEAVTRRDARRLDARIRTVGSRNALFSTWTAGDHPESGPRAAIFYAELASELGALLVPVAQAWHEAARVRPDLRLRMADGIHPGPLGTYLSACVFYACLYGESLEADDARAVRDDLAAVQELRRSHLRLAAGTCGIGSSAGAGPEVSENDLGFLRAVARAVCG